MKYANYAWLVDYDHLDNKTVEVFGPSNISPHLEEKLKQGHGIRFKMYDDDGELYYSGRMTGDCDGFEPLQDYGMPNAGACRIDVETENGHWETV